MITVQEVTVWSTDFQPNHKYIMSDDMSICYAYIKKGDKYPYFFNNPSRLDIRRRKFITILKTKDVDPNVREWKVPGSKGDIYNVTLRDGKYRCTCPAATYRGGDCKHIQHIKEAA